MGLSESDLRRVCGICRLLYSLVIGLGFRGYGVKSSRSGAAGEVLAADPGLVVETGPGGVGRRWN